MTKSRTCDLGCIFKQGKLPCFKQVLSRPANTHDSLVLISFSSVKPDIALVKSAKAIGGSVQSQR